MQAQENTFEVIVIGGGHAGVEAALAASRAGARTLLLTHNIETVGQMSCNPAIGGLGKSHLVREIDALGGVMARVADAAGIHLRTLNMRKGPAVRATRAQTDRQLYSQAIRQAVETQPLLQVFQQTVEDLIITNDRIRGVETQLGLRFYAPAAVLTVGTFLGGRIHVGLSQSSGGRAGNPPANVLAQRLRALAFTTGRLKTGTPPRLDGRSIDFSALDEQPGDVPRPTMSFLPAAGPVPRQISCYLTQTNSATHAIIADALDQSPVYNGAITAKGPRYCPSIEDKVVRFTGKVAHRIFLEPEGLHTSEMYPNGISTSLPFQTQQRLVRTIRGFEKAHITRPGYAIEYDYFDPRNLQRSLQTKAVEGLFFAGQINGTTGYEEAAAQGLLAGINAARHAERKPLWRPARESSYLGVMVDDLVTQGVSEPYRMFTSRVEYRLLLREDNADLRLTPTGRSLGLIDDDRWRAFEHKLQTITAIQERLRSATVLPAQALREGVELQQPCSAEMLLRRPEMTYEKVAAIAALDSADTTTEAIEQIETQAHYAGYVQRQANEIQRLRSQKHRRIPPGFDYDSVPGLSNELREKLTGLQPETIGQAERIQGMTPAALTLLLLRLKVIAGKRRDNALLSDAQKSA